MAFRNDLFDLANKPNNNKMPHTAYKQYILWKYGHLSSGNCIVIMSCTVWTMKGYKSICKWTKIMAINTTVLYNFID